MKKVLFVVDERKLGGVSIVLENILNNMSLNKLDVTVLVLHNNGERLTNLPKNVKVIYGNSYFNVVDLDFSSLLRNKNIIKALKKAYISYLMKRGKIEKYIKKARKKLGLLKYDIEIAFKAGFCSLFVAYGNASKKLNWVHEDYKSYNKTKKYESTFKKAFRTFDKHIVVSKEAAKSFNEIYDMDSKTIVIENYIDVKSIINKGDIKPKLDVKKENLNIVTLGRFCNEKGFDRLIDAVQRLKQENANGVKKVRVYILGYGQDEDMLNNRINEYGIKEYVQVINVNSLDNNPYSFMKECDVYIMPSRSESFGMVRIEALTLGLPVITTNVANSSEMIDENAGLIVDNSTNGIYDGLKFVLENKEQIIKMRENVKKYSYENENERILNKIKSILEENCEK